MAAAEDDVTFDAYLGGRLHLYQPQDGYRAGLDAVLLAASVPAVAGQSVLDLGCGVGAAALCLGARVPGLTLHGVERNADYAALAARNGLDVTHADLMDLPLSVRDRSFDHVIANPPYFDRSASKAAQNTQREQALGEETPLAQWVKVAAKRAGPKGSVHMIHRMARLPDILAAMAGRLGSIEVLPLSARSGRAPELCIVRARKAGRGEFQLYFNRILHRGTAHISDKPDYTPEITEILQNAAPLNFADGGFA